MGLTTQSAAGEGLLQKGGGLCVRLFQLFDVHDEGRISLLEFIQTCPLLCPSTTIERKLRCTLTALLLSLSLSSL
jgi:hypothetical protein